MIRFQMWRNVVPLSPPDGNAEVFDESYCAVGNTLMINERGLLINANCKIESNRQPE